MKEIEHLVYQSSFNDVLIDEYNLWMKEPSFIDIKKERNSGTLFNRY